MRIGAEVHSQRILRHQRQHNRRQLDTRSPAGDTSSALYIVTPARYCANLDFFIARRSRCIVTGTAEGTLDPAADESQIVDRLRQLLKSHDNSQSGQAATLSQREVEVLRLVALGLINKGNRRPAEHQLQHRAVASQEHHRQARHKECAGTQRIRNDERLHKRGRPQQQIQSVALSKKYVNTLALLCQLS